MQPHEPSWAIRPEAADAARAQLASDLRHRSWALSRSVQEAFAAVPRHVFVPEVAPALAYRDEAFVIKCGPDGLPVSSSSQPAMMAIMLGQLGLEPGHRVLEIGTGSGYNAAVMAAVVGPGGKVVSVDIDPELVIRARASLAAAGYADVAVICADGGFAVPGHGPFDRDHRHRRSMGHRTRVAGPGHRRRHADTAPVGAGDPALRSAAAGRRRRLAEHLCLAVRLRPHARRVRRAGDGGPATRAERPGRADSGRERDGSACAAGGASRSAGCRADPAATSGTGRACRPGSLADPERGQAGPSHRAGAGSWFPLAPLLPAGFLVSHAAKPSRLGAAVLLPGEFDEASEQVRAGEHAREPRGVPSRPGPAVCGFGPGGPALAGYLAGLARQWAELGRPDVQHLQIIVRPAAGTPRALPGRADQSYCSGPASRLRWAGPPSRPGWAARRFHAAAVPAPRSAGPAVRRGRRSCRHSQPAGARVASPQAARASCRCS